MVALTLDLSWCILDADLKSAQKKRTQLQLYDTAIEAALEHGFVGFAGVACERAYFSLQRQRLTDDSLSQRYWDRMMALYIGWSAKAKVDWLTSSFGYLHEPGQQGRQVPEVVVRQKNLPSDTTQKEPTPIDL
mmetsp:Transcript_48737/g.72779  ORF Transcript_48737/g.72779 Transcript_48737/m.72779 type:complete len:133 (+) Transcript_48737:439-837(+)